MIEAELPDGTILEFPDGTTPDVMRAAVQRMQKPQGPTFGSMMKDELLRPVRAVRDLAAGAVRGAGSIGATLLAPRDAAESFIARQMGAPELQAPERRNAMSDALRSMGADPDSMAFGAGKIGAEIAGTAGVGGALAGGAQGMGAAPAVVNALRTGGMTAGGRGAADLALRAGAGAAVGGASAGLVDPSQAGTGALIGGALPVAGQVAKLGAFLGKTALGGTTGVGGKAIDEAVQAGRQGGTAGQSFVQSMRGQTSMDDVLGAAKANVDNMRQQAQAAYRQGMAGVKADKTVLDMAGIQKSLDDAQGMLSFKGVARNPQAGKALSEVAEEVAAWRQLDPAEFHTPEGLDALKQRVGALMESIPFEQRSARKAVGDVYSAIKKEITAQAPEYAKTMKGYSEAAELVQEIEKALSLGQKSSVDTAMRKLQSLMRNNVNTSYGYRDQLAESMIQQGGRDIMPALAGQAMSELLPRGLQRVAAGSGGAGLALTGNVPAAAALAALSSPRLVGEAAYGVGRMTNPALVNALRQGTYRAAPVIGAQ
jgi:hypothetical protein